MSPGMAALASLGINGNAIILLFIFVLIAFIIGALWKAIVPGAIALAVIYLFTPPASEVEKAKTETAVEVKTEVVTEAKTEVIESGKIIPQDNKTTAYKEFMQDCTTFGGYTTKRCDDKWNNRDLPDDVIKGEVKSENKPVVHAEHVPVETGSGVRLLDVSNPEYVKQRNIALKNPNAVVMHATVR